MDEYKIIPFSTQQLWHKWLENNHSKANGVWVKFYKKISGKKTINYAEALDEALCFGWIDGQSKSIDEVSYMQKFTPRREKSLWSKNNINNVKRLIKAKRMKLAGLAAIKAAKKDGRWQAAYDPSSSAKIPNDFLKELEKNKAAKKTFVSLDKANLYAIFFRLQTAKKPETRAKRMLVILDTLKRGGKFH